MHIFELEKYRRIGVDFEDITALKKANNCKKEAIIANEEDCFISERRFNVEFVLSTHANYYALLGAKYIPCRNKQRIDLKVEYSNKKNENYRDTLSYYKETVIKGLTEYYAEIVLNTAIDYLRQNKNPNGKIIFDTAACCEVGSSPKMFQIATKTVLQVLLHEQYPLSDDNIKII